MEFNMEEILRRIVTQNDTMRIQLDALSSRLDDHMTECNHGQCKNAQQDRTEDTEIETQMIRTQSQSNNKKRRYRCSNEENQKESLRKSLQENIVLLVENVSFAASSLPDMLIANNCFSENETQEIRKLPNEKDQIRNVIRLLKWRSFEVMNSFLEFLRQECPHVAEKIAATYTKKVCEYNTKPLCGYCELKYSVDLKYLADHVWSIGVLDDLIYTDIVKGSRSQSELWALFTEECNGSERLSEVIDKIVSALKEKSFYKDLVPKVKPLSELKCACINDCFSSTDGEWPNESMTMDVNLHSSSDTTASPESSVYSGNGDTSRDTSDLEDEPIAQSQPGFINPSLIIPTECYASNSLHVARISPRPSIPVDVCYRQKFGVRKTPYDVDSNFPSSDQLNLGINDLNDLDSVFRRGGRPTARRARPVSSFY